MEGLNIKVDIYRQAQLVDDAVGGSVRNDVLRYGSVLARIAHLPPEMLLLEQGLEVVDLYDVILYPHDDHTAIEEEDVVIPQDGRFAMKRLRVLGFQPSSQLPPDDRAHIQLRCRWILPE